MGAVLLEEAGISRDEARLETRLLLLHAAGITPETLFLRRDDVIPSAADARFRDYLARRKQREPLAYIVGERGFYGLTFRVTPAVLIPRPETEFVVEVALNHIGDRPA